ncbi:host attachment protein [uncultured Rhodospira sp.]|uniref:host attachment protein n=1 Tax=uncultured Rhodospira sp. TaxID=1936189 RepID=UPI00261C8F65|nr:host attachment protein [uncultured Rhodospira sp.]
MTKPTTWVLVADAQRARLFEVEAGGRRLGRSPLWETSTDVPPSREITSDRPGRTFDSGGEGRHAHEAPTDPQRLEKYRFARTVAEALGDGQRREQFARLIVVAPPKMLGDLRHELTDAVQQRVVAEYDKDLSKLPPEDIERHLDLGPPL